MFQTKICSKITSLKITVFDWGGKGFWFELSRGLKNWGFDKINWKLGERLYVSLAPQRILELFEGNDLQ